MIDSKIYDEKGQHTDEFVEEIQSVLEAKSNDMAKAIVDWLDKKDAPVADYLLAYFLLRDLGDLYMLNAWMTKVDKAIAGVE